MDGKKAFGVTFFGIAFSGFFLNASTAGLFSILPLYARDIVGLSETLVAQIDSIAEMCAYSSRIFVGGIVDIMRTRKPLLVCAVAALAITQGGFLVVVGALSLSLLRCVQRMCSGFVAVPRDVMVGAVLEPKQRARGYALQRIFKTLGSVVGSIMVFPFLTAGLKQDGFQRCAAICVVFAFLALVCVVVLVKDPKHIQAKVKKGNVFIGLIRQLPRSYWRTLAIAIFYHLGHFSETFLVFRLVNHGMAQVYVPLCQIAWSVGAAAMVYPIGALADRHGVRRVLMGVFALMVCGNGCLATPTVWTIFGGMLLWGAQTYAVQSLLAAEINACVHENHRGTAFGVLYLSCGISLVLASTWAGYVWQKFGYSVLFSVGGAIGLISIFLVWLYFPCRQEAK